MPHGQNRRIHGIAEWAINSSRYPFFGLADVKFQKKDPITYKSQHEYSIRIHLLVIITIGTCLRAICRPIHET